ncbi:TerB N-terminal domain-containing protein [Komagataeibacter oboediens]|uniref:TerB N-terminal domain-containing protein n=1 Tax=Komagataeibacter TaxID=1434011 RepID=UPI00030190E9|nr:MULTISPECIES: TerB N-terminal domain-containing protein [Komagataeibacter]WEQ52569.1 TerB N-terminal domain-containing protein [Komagataeibacter oboediens]GCD76293.1 plasma membrane H+-transporting two-sector ATPase [Acetobacter pasteurianus NBRC 3299]
MFSWLKRIFSGSEISDTTNEATRKETIASSSTHSPSLHTQHAFLNDEEKLERYGQSRSHKKDDARWVLPGEKVTAHGLEIADGMVYVGNFLTAAPNGGWNADTPAPCLIRPSLKVASGVLQTNLDLGYWPSYTDITPNQRLTYLLWLASGKSDTSYPMGYPFLYFYGLERRLIADSPSIDEEVLLISEVKRLRELFGHNSSFVNYSTELLNFVEMKHAVTDIPRVEAWKPDLAALGNHMSPLLQAKLGLHALRGMPLDVDLAIAGILSLPPHLTGLWPRIATTRARPEFIELTRHRFNQKFPHGFRLRDKKESRLDLNYRSASQYLHSSIKFEGIDRLPDPAQLTWTKMIKLCEGAREDLSAFAKVVGKERERADSMAAALMLPAELGERETVRSFRAWLDDLPQPLADVPLEELVPRCFGSGKAASGLRQARDMSAMLARVGYGMEPDPTYGGTKPGENIILFRIGDAQGQLTPVGADFRTAALIMTAIGPAAKALTLGQKLVDALTTRLQLTPHETKRLTARLRLLPKRLPTLGRLKTIVESIEPEQQTTIASLAASAALTIGETDQDMMVALERLYEAVGLGRRELYTVLHQGNAAAASCASEPIVIEDGKSRRRGHRIPAPPSKAKSQEGIVIDMSKVGVILRETKEVEEILAPIYEDEAAEIPVPAAVTPTLERETRFVGLGHDQARLLEALVTQPEWPRSGFEAKAHELGLMPDGALEAINEWSYDKFDEELIEDGDPLIINMALLADAPGAAS